MSAPAAVKETSSADDAIADALWNKLLEDFEEDAPHNAFLEHCRQRGMLPHAAARYRAHKESLDAERDAAACLRCDKRLTAITLVAMAQMDARKTAGTPKRRNPIVLLIAFVSLIVAIFALYKGLG